MFKNLKKKEQGFTIIEVLIVLAIAGLIMVIVFLAVPALQRNSRNTQRTADASKVAGAIAQCMSNRNGVVGSCDSLAEIQSAGGLDTGKLSQITTIAIGAAAPADPANVNNANGGFVARCSNDGATVQAGSARQAAVIYDIEDNTGAPQARCIDV